MSSTTRAVYVHGPHHIEIAEAPVGQVGPDEVKVAVAVGGICGSDLHYYHNGGFGAVRLKAPMILGHELSGTVIETGQQVVELRPGLRVAINPSLPCGDCDNCRRGWANHCSNMRFYGSAMRNPHVHGGFRDLLVCKASQAVPVGDRVSFAEAALAEPLAVCLHAVNQAGPLLGKNVLITGAGPIGVLLAASARLAGAARVVITDIVDAPLRIAREIGADHAVNVASDPDGITDDVRRNGTFDVAFEAAGRGETVLAAIAALRPRGVLVLVGQGAELALQASSLVGREIELRGSFRFGEEFNMAAGYLSSGRLNLKALISSTLPAESAVEALEMASDKSRAMKVQLAFG